MVEAINHDMSSSLATAGGEAAKGGMIGGAIAIGGGALLGAAALAAVGAFVGAAGTMAVVGAVVGGLMGATSAGPMAAIGGLLGWAKGTHQVENEQQAFSDRVRGKQQEGAVSYNTGEVNGIKQGYEIGHSEGMQAGFEQGAQYGAHAVIAQIQQHMGTQQASAQPDMSAVSEASTGGGFSDKVASCKCESWVDTVDQQKQAAAASAAAGAQVG